MTKSKIIEDVYISSWFNEAIGKMHPEDLRDDLKQEVIIALYGLEDERVYNLHTQGFLKFWCIRVMMNLIKSDTSPFFKMYRNFTELSQRETRDHSYEETKFDVNDVFENDRDSLFERDVLVEYAQTFNKNLSEMSRVTGIDYKSLIRVLKNAKTKAKCYYRGLHR